MSTTSDSSTSPAGPFLIGSVVYLNGGGPPLTVTHAHGNGLVSVHWLVDGQVHTADLPTACLTTARPVFNDDLEKKQFFMQLATGNEYLRSKAYQAFGITDPVEAEITRAREDILIQKKLAQLRAEKEAAAAQANAMGYQPSPQADVGAGLFIVLEGIDGSGKTTQLQMLREHFEKQGRKVVCLREPGGTPLGEELRRLLKDPLLAICNTAELLMFLAARAQLLEQKVRLALECNSVVLMDRFTPSTIAYQGYGREMGSQSVRRLAAFVETITPRHTFWIDLPLTTARERLHGAAADKFDQLDDAFFTRTLEGYLSCMHTYPGFQHVDGRGTPEGVQQEILNQLAAAQLPA